MFRLATWGRGGVMGRIVTRGSGVIEDWGTGLLHSMHAALAPGVFMHQAVKQHRERMGGTMLVTVVINNDMVQSAQRILIRKCNFGIRRYDILNQSTRH